MNIALAARAEFHGHALFGAGAQALADIGAVDHEVLSIARNAPDQHMDMRIVGVPVIDRDPVEPNVRVDIQIACHILHHLAGESAQVRHLAGILRRDDEAEVMPVVLAALGEGFAIGSVRPGIEHLAVRSITGDTVAFEIGDMACERCGTKRCASMADNARFDDDAPLESSAATLERRALAAPEMSGAAARLFRDRAACSLPGARPGARGRPACWPCGRRPHRCPASGPV